MRKKLFCTCLGLLLIASYSTLYADQIAHFTAIQPLDLNPGPDHVDQIVTFDLPQGAPLQGSTDGVNFMIRTTATVHITDMPVSGPSLHEADAFAVLQFFNDGVDVAPTAFVGFPYNSFTYAELSQFFSGPVTSPIFLAGFYPSLVPAGGYSVTIALSDVPEPATLTTLGTSLDRTDRNLSAPCAALGCASAQDLNAAHRKDKKLDASSQVPSRCVSRGICRHNRPRYPASCRDLLLICDDTHLGHSLRLR